MKTNYKIDEFTVLHQFREAVRRWNDGIPYECSMGIADNLTYGYAHLDNNGFFEHSFPTELANLDIIAAENKIRWNNIRKNNVNKKS